MKRTVTYCHLFRAHESLNNDRQTEVAMNDDTLTVLNNFFAWCIHRTASDFAISFHETCSVENGMNNDAEMSGCGVQLVTHGEHNVRDKSLTGVLCEWMSWWHQTYWLHLWKGCPCKGVAKYCQNDVLCFDPLYCMSRSPLCKSSLLSRVLTRSMPSRTGKMVCSACAPGNVCHRWTNCMKRGPNISSKSLQGVPDSFDTLAMHSRVSSTSTSKHNCGLPGATDTIKSS